MQFLAVVSQQNQALRFRLFLEASAPGAKVLERIKSASEILFLDWGSAEDPIPSQLDDLAEVLGGAQIIRISLPSATQVFTKARYRDFTKIYTDFLGQRPELEEVFQFSYEGHYSVLATLCRESKVVTNLLEEGLGTYVHAWDNKRVVVPGIFGTFIQAARGLVGPVLKNPVGSSLPNLLLRFSREIFWGLFGAKIPYRDQLIAGFRYFDVFFTSFPDLARAVFPESKIIFTPFSVAMIENDEESKQYFENLGFAENDALFLGQTYLFGLDETVLILSEALTCCDGTLWIKPHPRLGEEGMKELTQAVKLIGASRLKIIETHKSGEFLVEIFKPSVVISLTSTTLTYVDQISPLTECISLADYALSLLDASRERSSRRTKKVLSADRAVLNYFPKISSPKNRSRSLG